jgi:hypothetical protein
MASAIPLISAGIHPALAQDDNRFCSGRNEPIW